MSSPKKSPALAIWLVIGVLVAGAVVLLTRPQSQPVRLLHVGYVDHGERGRSPVFCLTNGGTKPIAYAANYSGRPAFDYKVQTPSGWKGPYPFRESGYSNIGQFGSASSQANVLKPGESLTFEFARPMGPRGWKMGIAYHTCSVLVAPPTAVLFPSAVSGGRATPLTGSGSGTLVFTNVYGGGFAPSWAPTVVREPSFATKVSNVLPRIAPAWLKRALNSMDRDQVTWGPVMN